MTRRDWRRANLFTPDPARVIDVGHGWTPDRATKAHKKRRKSKRKVIDLVSTTVSPLIIPAKNAKLIISVMSDLGQTLPSKRNRLNNRLRRLIDDGVISASGEINRAHPLLVEWLELIERRERKSSQSST